MLKSFTERFAAEKFNQSPITSKEIDTFFSLSIGASKEVGKIQYSSTDAVGSKKSGSRVPFLK